MSVSSGAGLNDGSQKLQSSCPYIGMVNDPQTHVGVPDQRNCCHLVNPPAIVTADHQQKFCLGQAFSGCPVYQSSGAQPAPAGVFEGEDGNEKGFVLPFLAARRAQTKTGRSATRDVKTQPIPETKPEVKSDPIPDTTQDLSSNGKKPAPSTVAVAGAAAAGAAAVSEKAQQGISKTTPAATNASMSSPAGTTSGAVEDDEALRQRLYNEALSRYEQVNNKKKERRGFWTFLLIGALVIGLFAVWGIYNRIQNQKRAAQLAAEIGYTVSLATAVQDMGAAADAWGTAASLLEAQQGTATMSIISTATAEVVRANALMTAQASTSSAMTATPTIQATICQNVGDANLKVVSGPTLLPPPETIYTIGMDSPQASWIIQNTGTCGWSQILVWSIQDNTIVQPIIKRDGQVVTPVPGGKQAMIAPGDQVEVILLFPTTGVQHVSGEWVLVVDGLSLVPQEHIILGPTNWVLLSSLPTQRPTRIARTPQPGGGGTGATPTTRGGVTNTPSTPPVRP